MLAAAGLGEEVLSAAADHNHPMPQELLQHVLERQDPRLPVDECQKDQRERRLERGKLVELVEHHVGIGVSLQLQDQADRIVEIALVADRGDAPDAIVVDEFGDLLLDRVAGLLVGDLGDDDPVAVLAKLLDMRPGPKGDRAAAGEVAANQGFAAHHDAAGREVGAGHDLEQFDHRHGGVVDQGHEGPADFGEVVRRDARRHAHGDAAGAVDDQVGEPARQHHRLRVPLVVRRHVIDRVEFEIVEHQGRDRREAGLGVSHRGGRQAGDRAKVALLVHQHVPHVPFLGHADEGRIDHALAVGVVVAAGIAGNLRALHPRRAGGEVEVVHGDQDPPLRRLEPISHVGQGPRHDHAHGIRQVAVFQLLFDRQLDEPPAGNVTEAVRWGTLAGIFLVACRRILFVCQETCLRPRADPLRPPLEGLRRCLNIPVHRGRSTGLNRGKTGTSRARLSA